jgi:predicted Zn-dependent protease
LQAREAALEQEKQRRQARIQSYQGLVEGLPAASAAQAGEMQAYFDRYVEKHIDELDDKWKNAIVKAQESLLEADKQKARQALRSLDKEYPENAWVKLTLAMQLNPQRQKQEMLDLAKRVVRMTPNLALAHRVLAEAYELNEQPLEALSEYNKTLELIGEKQNEISDFAREHIEQIQSHLFQSRRGRR